MQNFRKLFVAFALIMLSSICASAQNLQEVVYLKNGSIIRGTIIEQKPNESLKIQTVDGNVFVFKMDEVDKITKEAPVKNTVNRSNGEVSSDLYGWEQAPRYRGFVGNSYIFGVDDCNEGREFLYTSHGCQINPFLYVGGGVGINYWLDREIYGVPVFGHVRSELHRLFKKNFSPYLDVKMGYSLSDVEGFYFAPSVGCHFYFGHSKTGISVGVGYVLQNTEYEYYDYHYGDSPKYNLGGVECTVAFDF